MGVAGTVLLHAFLHTRVQSFSLSVSYLSLRLFSIRSFAYAIPPCTCLSIHLFTMKSFVCSSFMSSQCLFFLFNWLTGWLIFDSIIYAYICVVFVYLLVYISIHSFTYFHLRIDYHIQSLGHNFVFFSSSSFLFLYSFIIYFCVSCLVCFSNHLLILFFKLSLHKRKQRQIFV